MRQWSSQFYDISPALLKLSIPDVFHPFSRRNELLTLFPHTASLRHSRRPPSAQGLIDKCHAHLSHLGAERRQLRSASSSRESRPLDGCREQQSPLSKITAIGRIAGRFLNRLTPSKDVP